MDTQNIPAAVLARLAALEQAVAEKGSLEVLRRTEDDNLQRIRQESIFQGLGKPVHKPYVYQPYPAWRYHAVAAPQIVYTEREDLALGDGWVNTPAKLIPDLLEQEAPLLSPAARRQMAQQIADRLVAEPEPSLAGAVAAVNNSAAVHRGWPKGKPRKPVDE